MSSDELVLASLLVSRLMHDLAASAGAVGNGIEMLREESGKGGVDAGALDLLEFSARETLRRLEFFRLAFGAAGGARLAPAARRGAREGDRLLRGTQGEGRLAPRHGRGRAATCRQADAESRDDLRRGAAARRYRLGRAGGSPGRGDRGGQGATLAEERKVALSGDAAALNARLVQPYYAGALARSLGSAIVTAATSDRVVLTAALPPG